ncbi:alpha/beta hydrolase [Zavarzinella formosa]|uniref:alpha/beta hydrolase n=1 Tax=Zavarzinella formosa TaxID=360055 RepID=UPI000363604B|nr:alpha/beta hydrolase [Zavarzinella formosa]
MRQKFLGGGFIMLMTAALAVGAEPKQIVIDLWPGVAPGEKGNIPEEKFEAPKANEVQPVKRLGNVSKPTITITKPPSSIDTGAAVVIAPGGGYTILAWEHEGTMVADWLNKIGVTAVVLKYRVPRRPDAPKDSPPVWALQDAQRAMGIVRSRAKEFGVDPARIGMLGFSAGGHLTAWTSTNTDKRAYEPVDDADKASCRPDFAVLIYPGGLLDKDKKLKAEINVSKDTPPCFFAVAYNDDGPLMSSVEMVKALREFKVNAEMHVYSTGGHGFGMKASDKPYATWPKRCEEWMQTQGYLKK